MGKITYQDISLIVEGFTTFVSEKKDSTRSTYIDIVKEYLLNEVRDQVDENDYKEIFSEERIIDFQHHYRISRVVRSALKKLKEYLIKSE